jgi:transposase
LFKLDEVHHMPLAIEAVRKIDAIFAAEATINGTLAAERSVVRQRDIAPLVAALETWMRAERAKRSRHNDLAQAMDYMLKRWGAFTRLLSDGRICMTNNTAERMLRGAALGRKAWLFAGSDQGGERAAVIYSLIQTAKLNGVDPRALLANVLARIADMPQQRLHELLPWNWKKQQNMASSAA